VEEISISPGSLAICMQDYGWKEGNWDGAALHR
jgi:hypothetical protein